MGRRARRGHADGRRSGHTRDGDRGDAGVFGHAKRLEFQTAALHKLGELSAEPKYLDAAAETLQWARAAMEQHPAGHCTLLSALEAQVYPRELVIVRGPAQSLGEWLAVARQGFEPARSSYAIPYDGITNAPPYLPRLLPADARDPIVLRLDAVDAPLELRQLEVRSD